MKYNFLLLFLVFIAISCNDDTSEIGFTIQPTEDKIEIRSAVFDVPSETFIMDSMFIKSDTAFLGTFTDKKYGTVKTDFLAQVSCVKNFAWHSDILRRPDSVALKLYYGNYFGDSLAPMNVVVYELTDKLENIKKNYYTNINPNDFCDFKNILGQRMFTAVDLTVPDSVKDDSGYDGPYISIRLKDELIERFYDKYQSNASFFTSTEKFTDFFKGFYVTTTFGDGTVLYIEDVYLQFYFNYREANEEASSMDTLVGAATFATNKEVTLSNRVVNGDMSCFTQPDDSLTYIKTPIGALTRLSLPIKEIKETVNNSSLNMLKLEINVEYDVKDAYMNYLPPARLLLIKESNLTSFFENGDVYDTKSSFISSFNSSTKSYTFSNMSKLLMNTEEDIQNMVLVPVSVYIESATSLISKVRPISGLSAVKLKKKDCNNRPLKLTAIYSSF